MSPAQAWSPRSAGLAGFARCALSYLASAHGPKGDRAPHAASDSRRLSVGLSLARNPGAGTEPAVHGLSRRQGQTEPTQPLSSVLGGRRFRVGTGDGVTRDCMKEAWAEARGTQGPGG